LTVDEVDELLSKYNINGEWNDKHCFVSTWDSC
jgi:hypothetical protein